MKSRLESRPLGFFNGSMYPANVVQRALKGVRAPQSFIVPAEIEHGGWMASTDTDRILQRFVVAQRCGLSVQIDEKTGKAKEAKWILTTGEELYDEYPIESVDFKDVSIQRLYPHTSTDLNLSNPKRMGAAAGTAGIAWWATAEHLPAIGEFVVLCAVGAAFLAEKRVRFGIKWGENNYAVGSMIDFGMSICDAIESDEAIFPPEGD